MLYLIYLQIGDAKEIKRLGHFWSKFTIKKKTGGTVMNVKTIQDLKVFFHASFLSFFYLSFAKPGAGLIHSKFWKSALVHPRQK